MDVLKDLKDFFTMNDPAVIGAMCIVFVIGSVAAANLFIFGVIDYFALLANAYFGVPRHYEKYDPSRFNVNNYPRQQKEK